MKYALIFLMLTVSSDLIAQSGWKTVKDKTGSCQISIPPNWTTTRDQTEIANSPQHTGTVVLTGMRSFKPFSAKTLQIGSIDKVFENSASRVFYVTKSAGNPSGVIYHVEAPGKANSCIAEIDLPPNTLEDDAKKIALSLSKTP